MVTSKSPDSTLKLKSKQNIEGMFKKKVGLKDYLSIVKSELSDISSGREASSS